MYFLFPSRLKIHFTTQHLCPLLCATLCLHSMCCYAFLKPVGNPLKRYKTSSKSDPLPTEQVPRMSCCENKLHYSPLEAKLSSYTPACRERQNIVSGQMKQSRPGIFCAILWVIDAHCNLTVFLAERSSTLSKSLRIL